MSFPRKRSGSNSKKLKEKYEVLFKHEEMEEANEAVLLEIIISPNINLENLELEVCKNFDQPAVKKNISRFMKYCINNCNECDDGKPDTN